MDPGGLAMAGQVTTVRIAIVGGGFTGAAIAFHLARLLPDGPPVAVIEPRETLGAGLAYSTAEPAHRINVPAFRMSLDADDPDHFVRWLEASGELECDPNAICARSGSAFPQRAAFGRYVAEQLQAPLAERRVLHLRDEAVAGTLLGGAWRIQLRSGATVAAERLVLAATHPLPGTPRELEPIVETPGYVGDPYRADALAGIALDARVLIVGSGLTAADVTAALDRRGHAGPILALSRNGLRSRGHPRRRGTWDGSVVEAASHGVVALLHAVRDEIRLAERAGVPWQWVMDRVREDGATIWSRLRPEERRKLVRHLRSFWDVHRFRVAPQVESVLERRMAEGRFRHLAARLVDARSTPTGLAVAFRRRGCADIERHIFDLVVNTTGPSHRGVLTGAGILPSLAAAGHLRLDDAGLGLAASAEAQAVGRDGRSRPTLYVAGPLARGTFGELMGFPEVALYAKFVAERAGG